MYEKYNKFKSAKSEKNNSSFVEVVFEIFY